VNLTARYLLTFSNTDSSPTSSGCYVSQTEERLLPVCVSSS